MLLDIYLKDLKIHIHTNVGMQMFTVLSGQNSEVTKMPFNKEVNFDTHNGQKKWLYCDFTQNKSKHEMPRRKLCVHYQVNYMALQNLCDVLDVSSTPNITCLKSCKLQWQ